MGTEKLQRDRLWTAINRAGANGCRLPARSIIVLSLLVAWPVEVATSAEVVTSAEAATSAEVVTSAEVAASAEVAGIAACTPAESLTKKSTITIAGIDRRGGLIDANGATIRLSGIAFPRAPDREIIEDTANQAARAALADMAVGAEVTLYQGAMERDRYGHLVAQACRGDGQWLQGQLLRLGHAFVATRPGAGELAREMLATEKRARAAGLGLWADRRFRVRNPHETRRDIDTFQIVEGRVVSVSVVRGRAYLNFGADWRSDFTFSVTSGVRKDFLGRGIDLDGLVGRRVRGRGWVTLRNGPLIELTHPEQLELPGE